MLDSPQPLEVTTGGIPAAMVEEVVLMIQGRDVVANVIGVVLNSINVLAAFRQW